MTAKVTLTVFSGTGPNDGYAQSTFENEVAQHLAIDENDRNEAPSFAPYRWNGQGYLMRRSWSGKIMKPFNGTDNEMIDAVIAWAKGETDAS